MLELQPKWRGLYDGVRELPIGESLSWTDLQALTGFDIRKNRDVIYRANDELLQYDRKMLLNVRSYGYCISTIPEQMQHGANRRIRAKRHVEQGIREYEGLDAKKMTYDQQQEAIQMVNFYQTNLNVLRKSSIKSLSITKEAAKATKSSMESQAKGIVQIDSMMEELGRLKKTLGEQAE